MEYISREAVNDLIEDIRNNHFILMSDRVTLLLLKSKVAEIPTADVQPVDSWISVNDRLPEAVEEDVNGKIAFSKSVLVYLVYDNGFTYITNDRFRVDSKSWLHEIPGEGCKVTHWMPLPEPPKDGEQNENN